MRRLINSPIGSITLLARDHAITGLYFGDQDPDGSKNQQESPALAPILDLCERELAAYFAGELWKFTVPIRPTGTSFRERVWDELIKIPYGETASYLDIAHRINNPKAVRAVGGANHNNPISIIVPCHRVIGSNGSLTGYGGGLDAKRWLLDLEMKHRKEN